MPEDYELKLLYHARLQEYKLANSLAYDRHLLTLSSTFLGLLAAQFTYKELEVSPLFVISSALFGLTIGCVIWSLIEAQKHIDEELSHLAKGTTRPNEAVKWYSYANKVAGGCFITALLFSFFHLILG